jgi:serine/threonine-protein kinase HipA
MNFRRAASECFVYITLPGETEFVTAGKFELTTDRRGIAVGRFVYGQSYLERENKDCEKISSAFAYPGFRPKISTDK